ncbi:phenylalanine N-monooxygenase-like, partial [Dioscorea cayenensis subsp. rotundata]|uniref:Phenylalanine N-monooxygenase-like n=1 Tax=Dioscorea cayennensis subsp. rotundata TaxID=55577 RepID=A0AB40BWR2_DIOCR
MAVTFSLATAAGVLTGGFLIMVLVTATFFFLLFHSQNPNEHGKDSGRGGNGGGGSLPPGPATLPIVGSLPMMLWRKPHFRWVLRKAEGKDITCIRLGNVHVIVVNSPELAREFLKKNDAIFASRPKTMATEYSGRGFLSVVFTPWGDQWKKMRRVIVSHVVNHQQFQKMSKMRVEEADNLVWYIQHQSKAGEEINLR